MTTFQDAKDSFYLALRDRLARLNPNRVVTVRGAARPAILVAENEMEPGDGQWARDTFVLHWGPVAADRSESMVLEHARCQIRFATAGSPEVAGMDRGRQMAALREELLALLDPARAAKAGYGGAADPGMPADPVPAGTPVFWTASMTEALEETAGELRCTCAVQVFAWKETP